MILPRSGSWTPKQRWVIAGCGLLALLVGGKFLILPSVWAKTNFEPLPRLTQVEVLQYAESRGLFPPPPLDHRKVPALEQFIDGHRSGWTGPFLGNFELPHPVIRADLYDGNRCIGYFAVGAGIHPHSDAVFELRHGEVRARKRVSRSEADRFLDLIGEGGELSGDRPLESAQRTVTRGPVHPPSQPSVQRVANSSARAARFHPGDRVRVKATGEVGEVCLRTRLLREDRYFVTLPGSYAVRDTIGVREEAAAWAAKYDSVYQPRPWHEEGPFYDSELELAP